MKLVARISFYALITLGCFTQGASAQLAGGVPNTDFTLTDWMTGIDGVTDLTFLSDGRAVITVKGGQPDGAQVVVADRNGVVIKNPAYTFTPIDTGSEKGLLGVVRDSMDNLYFYASNGPSTADKHRVYKGRAAADGTVTVDLANPIVTGGLEGPANHDGGGMVIHKNQLYIGVGDTGNNNTPPTNKYGACLNKPNGKILRVNLDGSIPQDNPLSNLAAVTGCMIRNMGNYEMLPPDKRIYAWGFRNPWRIWIDPKTDLLWIGDVGETTEEEITVGGIGTNHGWPFREGNVTYSAALGGLNDCMAMTPATPCIAPQDRYTHGGSDASVTGGLVPPEGCGWGAYENKYFFGDYNRGPVWTLDLKPDRSGAMPNTRAVFATLTDSGIVSFRMGPDGAMYIAGHDANVIKRIAPKTIPATCNAAQPGTGGSGGSGAGGAGGSGGAGGAGGAGGTGGAGGAGGAGGTGGTGGSAGSGTGGTAGSGTPPPGEESGCSCSLSPRRSGGLALGALMVLAAALVRRRRR
jgi:MYXO-CTERM domain-containing protein